jgi:hypothetical protein
MLNQVGREMHTADVDWPDPRYPWLLPSEAGSELC